MPEEAAATLSGIADDNAVEIDSASVADNDFAKFTANGLECRSYAEVLSDIGGQSALTFGISNTNAVKIDSASVADNEYARFTASDLESRSYAEVLSDIDASDSDHVQAVSKGGTGWTNPTLAENKFFIVNSSDNNFSSTSNQSPCQIKGSGFLKIFSVFPTSINFPR